MMAAGEYDLSKANADKGPLIRKEVRPASKFVAA